MSIISWDALFKLFVARFFQRRQLSAITEHEVSHQAQKIDAVVLCPTESHRQRLAETAFYFFKHYNLIEFKSTTDRLTENGYYLITSRVRSYLYQAKGANFENTVSCIVSTKRPQIVLTKVPRLRFSRLEKGHYIANELIDTHLYVISELPIEEKYYPLLLFAAGKQREEVLQTFVAKGEMEYISIALILYPETMRRIYTMPKGDYPTIEENLNVLIDWFGIDAIAETYLKSHHPDGLIEVILSHEGVDRTALFQTLIRQMDKSQVRQLIQSILDELDKEKEDIP
jgi:hypothetical protein